MKVPYTYFAFSAMKLFRRILYITKEPLSDKGSFGSALASQIGVEPTTYSLGGCFGMSCDMSNVMSSVIEALCMTDSVNASPTA
ncbi:hypothetical protein D0469_03445 [Peribacillus saganii]|uniref:Uncharacterized protein n=1 Tax=Peribacillus saganii TaxID=2303992 RepID=A0A372LSY2_9BACI|nr:hypothetical protein D0469_03445 [Peribacillus saganii]